MEKLIIGAALIGLVGCSGLPSKVETQIEKVPVISCPKPPVVPRPILPIETITDTDDYGTVAVKEHASLVELMDYAKQLEQVIQFYSTIEDQEPVVQPVPTPGK